MFSYFLDRERGCIATVGCGGGGGGGFTPLGTHRGREDASFQCVSCVRVHFLEKNEIKNKNNNIKHNFPITNLIAL
ncbi:hypothetical protein Y032_0032g2445 [Ancylostoma ceylanicum]|uniref:Uncharacterized protein n=1 Tax=Ancylostoma ceylanicum TaxID=53326 RepID=A0A016UP50_9BILA|nr:hypothetical protein Y032_0032g2445 [Ancylostoma ceylanicum]